MRNFFLKNQINTDKKTNVMNYNKTLTMLRGSVRDLLEGKISEFDRVSVIKKVRDGLRLVTYQYQREKSTIMPKSRFSTEIKSIKNNFKNFILS